MRRYLVVLISLLLPVLTYWAYVRIEHIRNSTKAEAPWWVTAPWPKLVFASVLLLAFTLIGMTLLDPSPQGKYLPAQVTNGQFVPGHMQPDARPEK
jgi:hypothetical protein